MNILELVLGQLPEAIFFAWFMILTNSYKEKRLLFTILMCIEYILLLTVFPYSSWSHILYFIISYIIMKCLYKNKCDITNVFILGIASIILIIVSAIAYLLCNGNMQIGTIITRVLMVLFLVLCRNKLPNIFKLYHKLWNRNNKPKKMKTTTFRALNLVIFNISFYIINIGMITITILQNWR